MSGRAVRDRVAAQSAMARVVELQRDVPPRGPLSRLLGASPLVPAARGSYRNALAELTVGDILENLGRSWDVLHDVPLGPSTLDHLLIGPSGAFAVSAAHCGGRDVVIEGHLVVGGEATRDISDADWQAELATDMLSAAAGSPVAVEPILVIVDARKLVARRLYPGVTVIRAEDLSRSMSRMARLLAGEDVARISDLADLETTWGPAAGGSRDVQELHRAFALTRAEVRSATVRRLVLGIAAAAVGCVALWMLVARAVVAMLGS